MNRLALFDCDGTLADSQASICAAMEGCFAAEGLAPPSRAAIRRIVGLSLVEAMAALHPTGDDAGHAALAEGYKRAFQRLRLDGHVDDPLFDGIAEALGRIEDAGWVLGVATGKSDRGLALLLDAHGLKHRFVTLQTADRHPSKPHPSMLEAAMAEAGADRHSTVMIGDTFYDIAMARSAGVPALGVAWGYHDAHELIAHGAAAVAATPADLPRLIEELVPCPPPA